MARPHNEPARARTVYLPPWRIDVVHRPGVEVPIPTSVLARTAAKALTVAGAPSPASLGLILSDDHELEQLNAAYMGEDGPTDVLSFPLLQPSSFPAHAGQDPQGRFAKSAVEPAYERPPRQRVHLGDIVISVERGVAQAAEGRGGQTGDNSWSAADELRLLVAHGVLHICGWDHARLAERDSMRALERDILTRS